MPQFYFYTSDGAFANQDDDGLFFERREDALSDAKKAAGELTKQALASGLAGPVTVVVCEENSVIGTLTVQWKAGP